MSAELPILELSTHRLDLHEQPITEMLLNELFCGPFPIFKKVGRIFLSSPRTTLRHVTI